jgi:hypothetical protein
VGDTIPESVNTVAVVVLVVLYLRLFQALQIQQVIQL